jgi:aspartyl-tRNA synthetase
MELCRSSRGRCKRPAHPFVPDCVRSREESGRAAGSPEQPYADQGNSDEAESTDTHNGEPSRDDPVRIGGSLLAIRGTTQRRSGNAENSRRGTGRQVAAAQRADKPVDGSITFSLDALDREDHPSTAEFWVQAARIGVVSGRHDLFLIDRALVYPVNGEPDVGAGGVTAADNLLADHAASEHSIRFSQRAICRDAGTATGERWSGIDKRSAGAEQHRGHQDEYAQDEQAQRKPGHVASLGGVAVEHKRFGAWQRAVGGKQVRTRGSRPVGSNVAPFPRKDQELVMRTHDAGTLRAEHAGSTVTLAGWVARRRDHGGVAFLDLRDASGLVQVVVRDEMLAASGAHDLRNEYCILITGSVELRPEGNANAELPTGAVEVVAAALEVLSPSAPLPFQIDERVNVGEETRLKYRYLDLRRPGPAGAIRLRSEVNRVARTLLAERGFVEIETPTLTRSTPEGARDFLVPARLKPGSWYALPQSPQLFKQLLMVAGMERYFQIARCYRDEDFRADRQPEFTQLDVEMSFVDQDDVIELTEALIAAIWRLIGVEVTTPLPRLTYAEAMNRFGTDKPDLRFGQEVVELTDYFAQTPFRVFQAEYVGAVVMPGGASQPRKQLDAWQEFARQRGHRGLAYVLIGGDGELGGPVAKNLSESERARLAAEVGAAPGDCIFFAAGPRTLAQSLLGATRLEIGRRVGLIDENAWAFCWVVDAPLFEPATVALAAGDVTVGAGAWTAVHHAFTAPQNLETFDVDPGSALAYAYDIVCNGNEIGGGSIRIHRRDIQERVFAVMGLPKEEAQEKFGFLLEAFNYGPPPHGGIAFGWDRICALLSGTESIRDVIAFPKTGGGVDPLTDAPAPITPEQRKEAGIDVQPDI